MAVGGAANSPMYMIDLYPVAECDSAKSTLSAENRLNTTIQNIVFLGLHDFILAHF